MGDVVWFDLGKISLAVMDGWRAGEVDVLSWSWGMVYRGASKRK